MQKYDVVTLYHKEFKVFHSISQAKCVPYLPKYPTLYEVCANPTPVKIERWNDWCEWFGFMNSADYGVYSFNPYCFTIAGTVEFLGGMYYVYSSEDRQRKREANFLFPMEY